jgi:protein SCO1/2
MKDRLIRWLTIAVGLCLLAVVRPVDAAPRGQVQPQGGPLAGQIPEPLEEIGIEDKSGANVPRDIRLVGSDGEPFVLGQYMDDERPLVLVLAYYGCPMLCSLVINGAMDGMKAIPETAGKDYRFLVVSFDPRDKTKVAADKRASYLEAYARTQPINGSDRASFEFATGDEAEVLRLAQAVGFRYRWDEPTGQFAHAAGVFVITPKGVLSQALTGIKFEPEDLSASLKEADAGTWRSPLKSVLLYCFQYNPHTGSYVVIVRNVMKVGGALTILGIAFFLYRMFRGPRRPANVRKPQPAMEST